MVYLVIPKLILQPTWGGDYIAKTKKIELKSQEIGQSYELYSNTRVLPAESIKKMKLKDLPYFIGTNDYKDEKLKNKVKGIVELKDLDPIKTFGRKEMPQISIKFTQAKSNSYQIHPKWKTDKYLPKPESWYFFEKGKVSLGLRPSADMIMYKEICEKIYKQTQQLSKKIKSKQIKLDDARKELHRFIDLNNPAAFVNMRIVETNTVVENTYGGIHHSWEEDNAVNPKGNIVFEVQVDVPDIKATIRGYDQGKILDDGTYRKLDIESYFKNLTISRVFNETDKVVKNSIKLKDLKSWKLNKLFKNNHYQMDELILLGKDYKVENLGFRHIFVREGDGEIVTPYGPITLHRGWSYIITPELEATHIKNLGKKEKGLDRPKFKILMTYPGDHVFSGHPS